MKLATFKIGGPTVPIVIHFVTFKNIFFPHNCHNWQKFALIILQHYV